MLTENDIILYTELDAGTTYTVHSMHNSVRATCNSWVRYQYTQFPKNQVLQGSDPGIDTDTSTGR